MAHSSEATNHERAVSAAICIAAIPFPYLGPIVGIVLHPRSPYVRFHAYRCLIEQVLATVLLATLLVASLLYSVVSLVQSGVFENGFNWSRIDWVGILVKSAATWAGLFLWNAWNIVNSVRDGLAAYRGEPIQPRRWVDRRAATLAGLMG